MKKNIFIISCLLLIQLVMAQSPGGVSGASRWYRADAGVTTGATMTWADQSGNNVNVTQATATNQPVYNSGTSLMNFNPKVTFDGTNDRLSNATGGINFGTGAYTVYYVASNTATATTPRWAFGFGASAALGGFNSGLNTAVTSKASGGTTFVTQTNQWISGIPSLTRTGYNGGVTQPYYLSSNGVAETTSTNVSPNITTTPFSIGARPDGIANFWQGDISEVIIYSGKHTTVDFEKVESYLALKWGITKQGNYVASDGVIFYNNTTYNNNIAGIGRDDASGLNQKQSKSQNTGNQVVFGLGTVAATNAANANTFTIDKQFLLWGDNGANNLISFTDEFNPLVYSRNERTWFVDNSNSFSQDTQLLIPILLTSGGSSPYLILNTSDVFASGTNTYIPLSTTTTINSISYYVVNLTAAQVANDFYFTIATNQKAPGGVATDLRFWLNMSAFTPSQWTDLSGNNNHFLSTAANRQPPIDSAKERANFHPSVDFRQSSWGGAQKLMHKTAPGPFTANGLDATIFASLSRESDTGFRDIIGFGGSANTGTVLTGITQANGPVWTANSSANQTMALFPYAGPGNVTTTPTNGTINQVLTTSKTHIPEITWRVGQANGVDYGLDGYQVTAAITPTAGNALGASGALLDGQPEINDGRISEMIGYERNLTILEKQKIRSYLALKYGVSQNQFVATNYLNSNGNVVWDATANAAFGSDIAGIGRDDFGALNQVMSKSINNVAEPLLSLTAIPSSSSNDTQASLVNFDNNNQYLIWGNNATRGFTPFTNAIDADINVRLSRVWKAQTSNYNLSGNDDIVFNFPEASVKPFINSGATVYLVLSSTPDFSSGNYLVAIPTTTTVIDGRNYISLPYNVASNAFSGLTANGSFYFTVAGKGQGPGGVLGIFWNRSDKDVVTTGSTVTKWTDQMYGIESTQAADNTNLPSIGNDVTFFNFHPYVNFTNTNQTLGNLSVAPAEGFTAHIEQFFVTRDNAYSGRFFGLNYDLRGSAGGAAFHDWNAFESNFYRSRANSPGGGTTTTNFAPTLSTTFTNLSHLISNASASTFGYRGFGSTVTNTTNANYNYIGQGGFLYGSNTTGTGLIGNEAGVTAQLAEHLIVGEALTPTERRQVESYLAVKYGITLSDLTSDASYRDALGNATFTTDATFRHDIFGIAKEAAAGIDQRISRSINNDAGNATNIITVSTDTNFTNLNATHADALSDGQYLIFASNNGAVAFTGGSAITAADGTVFSATEVLATRWKVQDKGAVGCVSMRFNNAAFTAVTGSTKYYMIVADDAAFTQNVTYREVTRDASSNIDVTVNFGDNTNGSATTGNYFTIARKNLGITAANLASVQTGINTIPGIINWKPTVANTYMEINSNAKGVIVSRVNGTSAIATPVEGMMIFDTSDSKFKVFTGSSWRTLGNAEGTSTTFCN